jgi:hypothetical protein
MGAAERGDERTKEKEEAVRKAQRDWPPRDWEGERGHPTLVARDAGWSGREAFQEEEAKDCKRSSKEEVEVDCGHEDRTEARA